MDTLPALVISVAQKAKHGEFREKMQKKLEKAIDGNGNVAETWNRLTKFVDGCQKSYQNAEELKDHVRELELSDFLLALMLVSLEHEEEEEKMRKTITSKPECQSPEIMKESFHFSQYATEAYKIEYGGAGRSVFCCAFAGAEEPHIKGAKVVYESPSAGVQQPSHYVAVDRARKCVILCIRGTASLSDVLTDTSGQLEIFEEYGDVMTNGSLLKSARYVVTSAIQYLKNALHANEGFEVVVTGHSLGAGTAILCSLLLQKQLECNQKLRCFAYAPPPVIDKLNAPGINEAMMYSFVNECDVVPRASLDNVSLLCKEVHAVHELDLDFQQQASLMTKFASKYFQQRANLITKFASFASEDHMDKVRKAVEGVRRNHLPRQFIPGTVLWTTDWVDQKMWEVDAALMKEMLLGHDFFSSLDGHLMGKYSANLKIVGMDLLWTARDKYHRPNPSRPNSSRWVCSL